MNRNDYGTYWGNDAQDVRAFSGPCLNFAETPDDCRGFRLVHDSAYRVLRGGSRDYAAGNARAAFCGTYDPGGRLDYLGLRLVRDTT